MRFDRLDEFLRGLEARGKACTDCAVYRDGRLLYRGMRGMSDRERGVPVGEDTIFRMYSMTKPITCAAMLQLYEQGRFLMTDPVALYLPEFARMTVQHHPASQAAPITMRHLFTMTSGLSYDLFATPIARMVEEKERYTTRDFSRAIARTQLLFEPGTHWSYGLSHDVLAACLEVISGMRFGDYLKQNIFEPLGISDAWFHIPDEEKGRACVRYGFDEGRFLPEPDDNAARRYRTYQRSDAVESGGAGLNMTVNAYARFANMLAHLGMGENGAHILEERTVELMRTNHLTPEQRLDFDWVQHRGYGYGLGVRTLVDRAEAGALGGNGEFGWTGAAGTFLLVDPALRLAVVYAQQATPSEEAYIHPRLRNLIYAALGDS